MPSYISPLYGRCEVRNFSFIGALQKQIYQLSVVQFQLQLLNQICNNNMKVKYHTFMKLQPSLHTDGVFTLPLSETDKNMACIGLFGGVHTAQRQITTHSHWVLCTCYTVICLGLSLGLVLRQCECTMKQESQLFHFQKCIRNMH